jgi:hypothetical protein
MKKKDYIIVLLLALICMFRPESLNAKLNSKNTLPGNGPLLYLNIPNRADDAAGGTDFADQIADLSLKDREIAVVTEILSGNIPSFCRKLHPVKTYHTIGSDHHELIVYTAGDYMAIGSDQDYLYVPMTPSTAQYLANKLNCSLPTAKMVDQIYAAAKIKLRPQPIPPSDQMTTVPVFKQHTDSIRQQIRKIGYDRSAEAIMAGHKKDIILSNKIYSADRPYDRVVIYGWHKSKGRPIQPVYNGHYADYADYSHGVRLVLNQAKLNSDSCLISDILRDEQLALLLNREGPIPKPWYPAAAFSAVERHSEQQLQYRLYQNYPNPFNPITKINYDLPHSTHVLVKAYNLLGQEIKTLVDKVQQPGQQTVIWNGTDQSNTKMSSGVYIYQLSTTQYIECRKMILLY